MAANAEVTGAAAGEASELTQMLGGMVMKDWKMLEQVKDAETPEEMRAELYRLQYYDPLVRAVMDSADYRGASAEDRYTVLAYNALKQLAEIKRHVLDDAMLRPAPRMIVPPNAALSGERSESA